jgi:phytoene synthase
MPNPQLDSSYAACVAVARREAGNFYPSFRLLPAERRRSMCALYAFLRRTDDLADGPGTVEQKRQALKTWRDELTLSSTQTPTGWAGWPALTDTVARHGIPLRYLNEVIDGVESDLEPRPFATFDDLYGYCYRVASAVGLCCLHVWGFRSDGGRAERLAEACGVALQLTNIVRDVREDAVNGRVYLPVDEMERFGVTRADLDAAHAGDRLRALLAFEGRRAYEYYDRAAPLSGLVSPVGRPVLEAIVGVYRALLDEIARRGYDVLPVRVSISRWRKAAVAARALAGRFSRPPSFGVEAPPPR